jgi:hypothetical protein
MARANIPRRPFFPLKPLKLAKPHALPMLPLKATAVFRFIPHYTHNPEQLK